MLLMYNITGSLLPKDYVNSPVNMRSNTNPTHLNNLLQRIQND